MDDNTDSAASSLPSSATAWLPSERWSRIWVWSLLTLALFWCVVRFWGLENAPYGIWMDESRVALHTICLAQTGKPAGDEFWPLFAPAFGGGHHPSALLYFDLLWTSIFGTSIASFRSAEAFFITLTIVAISMIARRLGGSALALFVLLSAAISPWAFQFSRVAWEGPMGPLFMVLSVYFLLREPRWYWAVACGVCGALAMFMYPPVRLATPLVLTLLGAVQLRRRAWRVKHMAIAVAALVVTFSPVLVMTLQGRISSRAMDVAIFSPEYIADHRGSMSRVRFLLSQFLDNLLSHFRPSFLFFSGDENVRHSAHLVGQLSPVDAVALSATGLWLLLRVLRELRVGAGPRPGGPDVPEINARQRRLLLIVFAGGVGFVCGSIPAALTWDGEPHALRSIAAWPWACLAGGAAMAFWVSKYPRVVLPGLVLSTALYTGYYVPHYFRLFAELPEDPFRRDIREAIDARADRPALEVVKPWLDAYGGEEELRYYLIRWDKYDCEGSAVALRQLHEAERAKRARHSRRERSPGKRSR